MKPLIIANWKMNPLTLKEAKGLLNEIEKGVKDSKTEVVVCPPFTYLSSLKPKSNINLGAQDCSWEEKGPYTGEVSVAQLKDLGCKYVILGHSERRRYQKETDEMVNQKVKAVLAAGLTPVVCTETDSQIKGSLKGVSLEELSKVLISFELFSIIGSGEGCDVREAKARKDEIKKKWNVSVLYGGSVNSSNAKDYIEAGYDGLLIGGASLRADEFSRIIKSL
jgi:triosephosphate isomerase